ncbi:MAG: ectoine synthase [Vulcanimicrobiota bacterium]
MIVKTLEQINGSEHDIDGGNWRSRRLLLAKDKMGFSMHDTVIKAGTQTTIWYKNHVEAVYCIEGTGEIETLPDGTVYPISPGTLYALDGHEKHYLRGHTDMRMVCVFNPPLTGKEVHDADGVYPLEKE